ncbi:MAG: ferritin family protein [Azonexus sp.]|jgi:rubrerythrin|nr:ferritin family protein [Azonexus sp.]
MENLHLFLAHAIELESDSARRYEELVAAMEIQGSPEVVRFFERMAHYSRLHLRDAIRRAGHLPPPLRPEQYCWPDGYSPEAAAWERVDGFLDVAGAMTMALEGERRSHAFYAAIAETTTNPRIRKLAGDFAIEEAGHVALLEAELARLPETE